MMAIPMIKIGVKVEENLLKGHLRGAVISCMDILFVYSLYRENSYYLVVLIPLLD